MLGLFAYYKANKCGNFGDGAIFGFWFLALVELIFEGTALNTFINYLCR